MYVCIRMCIHNPPVQSIHVYVSMYVCNINSIYSYTHEIQKAHVRVTLKLLSDKWRESSSGVTYLSQSCVPARVHVTRAASHGATHVALVRSDIFIPIMRACKLARTM
jgi:hypothetical protein